MSQLKILVVDDNSEVATMLAAILSRDYDCTSATRAVDAFMLYEAAKTMGKPYDLIVLDLAMPEQCGYDLARQIRSIDTETRIAFLSAYNDPDTALTATSLNIQAVWHKPIDAPDLRAKVSAVLAEQKI